MENTSAPSLQLALPKLCLTLHVLEDGRMRVAVHTDEARIVSGDVLTALLVLLRDAVK